MHSGKPTALFISLDRGLLEDNNPVIGRLQEQVAGLSQAIFLVLAKDKAEKKYDNLRVVPTGSCNRLFYVFDALVKTRKILSEVKIDAVVTQDPVETALIGWAAASWAGAKLIVQDHGYHFHGDYYRKESLLNRLRYLFGVWIVKRADAVRVVSKRTEDALIDIGVAKEKIVRFPLSIHGPKVRLSESPNRTDGGQRTSDQRQYFLMACRFVPIKRIDLAIHAFSLIADKHPEVKLKIVGRGPLEGCVKDKISEFNLIDRVEIIPWTNVLNGLYKDAVATLITSDREGFGMTAVESLANGTPVVMTDVGCAGEAVIDGVNGYVVPVGDVEALSQAMQAVLDGKLVKLGIAEYSENGSRKNNNLAELIIETIGVR